MFQALGNTIPPLLSSFTRITLIAIPVLMLSRLPGFHLTWIWSQSLSVTGVALQMIANLLLLRARVPPAVRHAAGGRDRSAFLVGVGFLQPGDDAGSASVVVSPSALPSAMSRSSRRMILPDRVLGRSAANRI